MGDQNLPRQKFTWKIENYSNLTDRKYYSDLFIVGDAKWRMLVYPNGTSSSTNYLSIYLHVADARRLPVGWSRDTSCVLTLVNQTNANHSKRKDFRYNFIAEVHDWGFSKFILLCELQDNTKGFVVNDAVVLEADVTVHNGTPPLDIQLALKTDKFESFFFNVGKHIKADSESSTSRGDSETQNKNIMSIIGIPNLEEIEQAKQSLKECLSDLFKLNMKDRLANALSTLSLANAELSSDQRISVQTFWADFEDFISDFLTFEQDNSEYELQKLLKDQMFSAMKRNFETHNSYKYLLNDLVDEEKELEKKLKEVESKRTKLLSEWESLMAVSEEVESTYRVQEKKVAEAEEKKRIAEERMSRSTTAWSNMKALFG